MSLGVNSDDDALKVVYHAWRLPEFSMEELALGFINALKLQGLENSADPQATYAFEDTEYPDGKIRVQMEAVPNALRTKTIRSSVMYALAALPIMLMGDNHLAGVEFFEKHRRRYIYHGTLDRLDDTPRLELSTSNASAATREKRSSHTYRTSVQNMRMDVISLTTPGDNSPQLEVRFYLVGLPTAKKSLFSNILMMMYELGVQNDAAASVERVEMSAQNSLVWFFGRRTPRTTFPFAIYHLLALLEGMARYYVQQNSYMEIVYDLFADGELVSGGCITQPVESRKWCAGLRGARLGGFERGDFTAFRAL